jgi:hypothetical protein
VAVRHLLKCRTAEGSGRARSPGGSEVRHATVARHAARLWLQDPARRRLRGGQETQGRVGAPQTLLTTSRPQTGLGRVTFTIPDCGQCHLFTLRGFLPELLDGRTPEDRSGHRGGRATLLPKKLRRQGTPSRHNAEAGSARLRTRRTTSRPEPRPQRACRDRVRRAVCYRTPNIARATPSREMTVALT